MVLEQFVFYHVNWFSPMVSIIGLFLFTYPQLEIYSCSLVVNFIFVKTI